MSTLQRLYFDNFFKHCVCSAQFEVSDLPACKKFCISWFRVVEMEPGLSG